MAAAGGDSPKKWKLQPSKLTNFLMRLGNGRAEVHSLDDERDTSRKCTNLTCSPCSLQPGVLQDSQLCREEAKNASFGTTAN